MKPPKPLQITLTLLTIGAVTLAGMSPAQADQQILDDLIVDGSACIGQDCVNGESFGFDTIRLKENNLRIKFQDTSTSASFPTNDWQLTANDSSNGGANKFSIDDIDGGRTPFTIEAGAPSHSLYVEDGGRLGLGTSTPVVDIHVKSGNTPTLRLEQDGSSGFTAQTWDVAGNEAGFFVRDATSGSTLPFRIRPGAGSESIDIQSNGDVNFENADKVGIGTSSPSDDGTSELLVDIEDHTGDVRLALDRKDGAAQFGEILFQEADVDRWSFGNDNSSFYVFNYTTGNYIMQADELTDDVTFPGNVTVTGTFTNPSDRNLKENIEAIDTESILRKVAELPVSSWNYKADDGKAQHIGPMAQDFRAAFGLGSSDKSIDVIDVTGVTLATVKALNDKVEQKDAQISELTERLEKLEKLLLKQAAE